MTPKSDWIAQSSWRYSPLWVQVWALVLSMAGSIALACQVPVFRYALERWLADKYEIVVLHDRPLDAAAKVSLAAFEKAASQSNYVVRSIHVKEELEPGFVQLWKEQGGKEEPVLAMLYPRAAKEIPNRLLSVGPFSDRSMQRMIDSPARRELCRRLLDGQSAVWLFVPSGRKEADDVALANLRTQTAKSQSELVLPSLEELEIDEEELRRKNIQLRIEFSIMTIAREDPREEFLLKMLLKSESDLEEANEPLAFPVFGRGRVLYALVGKGINAEMVHGACKFVVGPCSCQVKQQNPGFDLLTPIDWEGAIGDNKISDPLPESESPPKLLSIPPGKKK